MSARPTRFCLLGRLLVVATLAITVARPGLGQQHPADDDAQLPGLEQIPIKQSPHADLYEMIRESELIFEGTVTAVAFKNSAGSTLPNEEPNPIPHTFVTYAVERVFKGLLVSTITLRFMGGFEDKVPEDPNDPTNPDPQGPEFTFFGHSLLFDAGDRDILFVRGNTLMACPVVEWDHGRFRIIAGGRSEPDMMYFETGHEVCVDQKDILRPGEYVDIPEINTHSVVSQYLDVDGDSVEDWNGIITLERVTVIADNSSEIEPDQPTFPEELTFRLRHMSAQHFRDYLARRIAEADDGSRPVPVPSADIATNFTVELAEDASAPANQEPPDGTDPPIVETAAERLERLLLEQNNENPVLPEEALRQIRDARDAEKKNDEEDRR